MRFLHARRGTPPGRFPTMLLEHEETALVFDARTDVGTVVPILAEEPFSHARYRRRPVNLKVGNSIRSHVPALEDEARVVHAVVVMQVADEGMAHVNGSMPALDEPVVSAWAVIHHDQVVADLDQITRALARKRRRGRSRCV